MVELCMELLQFFKSFIPYVYFPNEPNLVEHLNALVGHVGMFSFLLQAILFPLCANPHAKRFGIDGYPSMTMFLREFHQCSIFRSPDSIVLIPLKKL